MADETLRHSLARAFDPGPDYPHPMLLSRTMAMLDASATPAARASAGKNRSVLVISTSLDPVGSTCVPLRSRVFLTRNSPEQARCPQNRSAVQVWVGGGEAVRQQFTWLRRNATVVSIGADF